MDGRYIIVPPQNISWPEQAVKEKISRGLTQTKQKCKCKCKESIASHFHFHFICLWKSAAKKFSTFVIFLTYLSFYFPYYLFMKQNKLVPACLPSKDFIGGFKQRDVIPHRPIKAAKAGLSLYALNREVNTCFVLRKGENLKVKGVSIMPANKKEQQNAKCQCGSGKKYGACCGRDEICHCGSGKKAGECCFK